MRKEAPKAYEPEAAIALDTNEESLDGVMAAADAARLLSVSLGGVRRVQATHFRRRRRLARKKADDRRVKRRLLACEGRRERDRVKQRLHVVSKGLVGAAKVSRAAIVLEDLTLHGAGGPSRRMNRRLSSWPHGENPSSDRVQGRSGGRARHQSESEVHEQDLPSVWRPASR